MTSCEFFGSLLTTCPDPECRNSSSWVPSDKDLGILTWDEALAKYEESQKREGGGKRVKVADASVFTS